MGDLSRAILLHQAASQCPHPPALSCHSYFQDMKPSGYGPNFQVDRISIKQQVIWAAVFLKARGLVIIRSYCAGKRVLG